MAYRLRQSHYPDERDIMYISVNGEVSVASIRSELPHYTKSHQMFHNIRNYIHWQTELLGNTLLSDDEIPSEGLCVADYPESVFVSEDAEQLEDTRLYGEVGIDTVFRDTHEAGVLHIRIKSCESQLIIGAKVSEGLALESFGVTNVSGSSI